MQFILFTSLVKIVCDFISFISTLLCIFADCINKEKQKTKQINFT
jgi:hypothetical protein